MSSTFDIDRLLGAAFSSFVIGCIIYGIIISQVYVYYTMYADDKSILKIIVALICLMETLHSIFSIHMMWEWLVTGLPEDLALAKVIWSIKGVGYLHVFMIILVQGIYMYRIWSFSDKALDVGPYTRLTLRTLIILASALAISAVTVFFVELQRVEYLLDFASGARWLLFFTLGTTCIVDIGIAVGMCWVLQKSKIRVNGIRPVNANGVLSKIIIFFISSGLFTSVIASSYMVLYATLPSTLLFVGATFSTSKLYSVSGLTMINARRHLRSEFMQPRSIDAIFSDLEFRNALETPKSDKSQRTSSIHVVPGILDVYMHSRPIRRTTA